MNNKYNEAISKIKVDENFKEKLILNLEQESKKQIIEDNKYVRKDGILIKIRKVVMAIISALVMLMGSGVAYAALGGTINGIPALEWLGIKFSNNYVEYKEPVENQVIENEDVKIALQSTVCDDGFVILQFKVNVSEDRLSSYETEDAESEEGLTFSYLSFNDPVLNNGDYKYTELNGANYNLIIDGEKLWVRGEAAQSVEEISKGEYLVYQMWFLDEYALDSKEEFEITLNDVSVGIGEECIAVDGGFNIELSKEKALNNTTTIIPKDDITLKYKKMEKSIEKISITPLQNIIKIKTVYKDISMEDLTYVLDEDYVGSVNYIAFDQNDNLISSFVTETEARIIYSDGIVEECEPGKFDFERNEFKEATYEIVEMVAVEQNEEINEIKLELYEVLDYSETIKNIMEYRIDLETNKIEKENKDVVIYDLNNSIVTDEYKVYYKKYYGIGYEEVLDNSVGLEALSSISNIKYMEIEVEDADSEEGVTYREPLKIEDFTIINEFVNVLNNSEKYEDFEKDFGVGGFFEGSPIVTIYLKDGKKLCITACDDFSQRDSGEFINVMNIIEVDKYDYEENSQMYIVNSNLGAYIESIYGMMNNGSLKSEIGTYKKVKSLNIDDKSYPSYIILKNNKFYVSDDLTSDKEYLFGTYELDGQGNISLNSDSQDFAFFNASEVKLVEVDGKANIMFDNVDEVMYFEKIN